ncbi:MAG: hypothetical protein H0U42_04240 [Thermoleophilaceae bacterium]|nr:hypothetical protein [Thermoleophilaceae bacterium]
MSSRTVLAAFGVLLIGVVEVGSVMALVPFGDDSAAIAYLVGLAVALCAFGVLVMGVDFGAARSPGSNDGGFEPDPQPREPGPPREPAWWDGFEREFRDYTDRPVRAPAVSARERELVGVE